MLAASRLQRWAILLSGYEYDIQYRTSKQNAKVNFFSRLPNSSTHTSDKLKKVDQFTVLWTNEANDLNQVQIQSLPVSAKEIATATSSDPILSRVRHFVLYGWPGENLNKEMTPYFSKQNELSVEGNCLLWGIRVIIPSSYRDCILSELHASHPGMVRMKSLARMHVYWPGLDLQIEQLVESCNACQSVQSVLPKVDVNPWKWPTAPWQRIHVDFAGPFLGHMYLIVVDAHSKWPEVNEIHNC